MSRTRSLRKPSVTYKSRYGKKFEAEIRNSLRFHQDLSRGELWWMRLMDFMDFYSIHPNMKARHQPADFLMVRRGEPYLLECKCTISLVSFPFEFVTDHQMESMELFTYAGGKSYLIIKHDKSHEGLRDQVFAIDIKSFLDARKDLLALGFKSIKWEEIARRSKELVEIKNRIWSLSSMWEGRTLSQL